MTTTGAGNDVSGLTVARKMVVGHERTLGASCIRQNEGPVFLGMQSQQSREYSEAKAQEIDEEVHRLVMEGYGLAKRLIGDNLPALHEMAKALLEFETIDGDHVDMLVAGGSVDDVRARIKEHQTTMDKEQEEARKESKSEREELISTTGGLGDPDPVSV